MLRELLYVDVTRVRSLLSQLDQGVVDTAVERRAESTRSALRAAAFGIAAEVGADRASSSEQSRSLQDLLFMVFEEAADSEGLIRELGTTDVDNPEQWTTSSIAASLEEGELLRLFLPMLLVDPLFVRGRLQRFIDLSEALIQMQRGTLETELSKVENQLRQEADATIEQARAAGGQSRDQIKNLSKRIDREIASQLRAVQDLADEQLSGLATGDVLTVANVIEKYLPSDEISVRFVACGPESPHLAFVGTLLGREEYIQREREALYARYGSLLEGWTAVVQVAAVPTKDQRDAALSRSFEGLEFTTTEGIERGAIEQAVVDLLGHMEALGVAEGPLWPAVSVIPLGIYRTVPRSDATTTISA